MLYLLYCRRAASMCRLGCSRLTPSSNASTSANASNELPPKTIAETNGCLPPWDTALEDTHKLFSMTNHHAPHASMLPVVTVPQLDHRNISITLTLAAVDEDGLGRPVKACSSATSCNNIVPFWDMKGMGTYSARRLTTHSDKVSIDAPLGAWILGQRDDALGGGVTLLLQGPMQEPNTLYADAMYPERLSVGDVMHVSRGAHATAEPTTPAYLATTIEFTIRVCKELKPYVLDEAGIRLYADQVGKIGAVFATRTGTGHERPSGRVVCYAGSACVFQVSAVLYHSEAGSHMQIAGGCLWGDTQLSNRCVDLERPLAPEAEVYIDTMHAALQGCPHSLTTTEGATAAASCHELVRLPPTATAKAIGVLNITLFGNRGRTGGAGVGGVREACRAGGNTSAGCVRAPPYPFELDIGRKIPMCFQARECPTCCYRCVSCIFAASSCFIEHVLHVSLFTSLFLH